MKKAVLVLGLAGAAGIASQAAHAQSSVTLYGIIDTGFAYTSNQGGQKNYSLASGNINGSRWGLRGAEDLGDGLQAIFDLESGYNVDNGSAGQGSRAFGRQAYVGLKSNTGGTVTLGRQYASFVDAVGPFSLTGGGLGGSHFSHPYDADGLDGSARMSNSVKYNSPTIGGFNFGAQYAFSNSTSFATNSGYSFGATYKYAGFSAAAGYMQLNNPASALNANGAFQTSDAPFTAGTQRAFGGGVSWAFSPTAAVDFVFTQTIVSNATAISSSYAGATINGQGKGMRFTNYEINGRYNFTPSFLMSAAYTFTDARVASASPKYNQISLLADYYFSKRTDVYLEGVYQHVSSAGTSGVTADILGSSGASSNGNQVVATVGLRHRF